MTTIFVLQMGNAIVTFTHYRTDIFITDLTKVVI